MTSVTPVITTFAAPVAVTGDVAPYGPALYAPDP